MLKCLELAEKEYERSNGLYPMFHSTHEGYAVIKEEVDELWDYIKTDKQIYPSPEQRAEVIQIMAMCLKMDKSFDDQPNFHLFELAEESFDTLGVDYIFHSTHEGYAKIKQMVDRLWDKIREKSIPILNMDQRYILVLIMAMCIKFLESFKLDD